MPMMRLTARNDGIALHDHPGALRPALDRALKHRDCGTGPVTVMIHGYSYQPGLAGRCPHDSLHSLSPDRASPRIVSWPRHLGLGRGRANEGLGLSFGWPARGSVWRAFEAAGCAGAQLAGVLDLIQTLSPGRQVNLVGHSMGARVALAALAGCRAGSVSRLILLTPAEYAGTARAALRAPAGRQAQALHVTSGENALFDYLMQAMVRPPDRGDRIMGLDAGPLPNAARLRIDCPDTLDALGRRGFPVAAPLRRICHWSGYLRPGLFPLYRAFLSGRIGASFVAALGPERAGHSVTGWPPAGAAHGSRV